MKDFIIRTLTLHRKAVIITGAVIVLGLAGISIAIFHHSKKLPSPATPGTTQTTGADQSESDTNHPKNEPAAPDTSAQNTAKTPAQTASPSTGGTGTGGGSAAGTSSNGSSGGSGATPPLECPALPAFPDENCTGYAHTGVTLHACSSPLTNATYDSCLFTGEVNVSAANITVTRSKIVGYVAYRTADNGSLRGLTLTDVEIDSTNDLGGATIGNNDYTCIRCNVHGGTRGFNVGYNVTIQDSYTHGWHSQNGDHITGIGSNGGAHNVINHNNVSCDILNDPTGYACSSGLSVYGDDAPGNDDWKITNNLINSGSSYCMNISGPPSKPYPFTNMVVTGNHFGNVGARARNLPDSKCTEFGPINQPGGGVHQWNSGTNNIWSGNVDSDGNAVDAPS